MKRITILASLLALTACSEADVASRNISKGADYFEIQRRIVFFNGITDQYLLTIEGRCSLGNSDPARQLTVTCKTGPSAYKKHFLGLSDNVSYFVEQQEQAEVNAYNYRVIFRPQTLVPSLQMDVR